MLPTLNYQSLLLQCRPGFEKDCAAEITARAEAAAVSGYCRSGDGHVVYVFVADPPPASVLAELSADLIFARQHFFVLAELRDLPTSDRATPIAGALASVRKASGLFIEHIDSNEGKQLSPLCRKIARPLEHALRREGVRLDVAATPRLHVFFPGSTHALVGLVDVRTASPWPLGIPRLRTARHAPSRSARKLEEALHTFLDAENTRMQAGMQAVDLGAAPGGWSWVLAQRGIAVTAVDNGPLADAVLDTGLVEHRREDGFHYRPPRPVDWLVCDMVEQPHRVAALIVDWFRRDDCRNALFNLKLPMKQRYRNVMECLTLIDRGMARAGIDAERRCKQLYHDRDEVTVYLARSASAGH